MKTFKLIIFIIFSTNLIFGQTPTININCSNCLTVDPDELIIYTATLTNGDYGTWDRLITWSATPSGSFESNNDGQGTLTYKIQKWLNLPNSPTRKIKITVKFTKGTQTPIIVTDERVVTVKHIGVIPSMGIPGASPSSPSDGSTASIACGVQNITISVGQPATDPLATVNYVWYLPSGWSGSSTTNSIAVTTSAGSENGYITVSAKRADGNKVQIYSVYVTRPKVSNAIITSVSWSPDDKPLCNSEQRVLSGTSTQNATTYAWSTTGGTSISGANNQSTVTVQGTSNGTLTLVASNACTANSNRVWTIFANTPQISGSNVLVDGHPNYYPNYTSGTSVISIQNGAACQTYKWEIFGGSGYIYPSSSCGGCGNVFNGITFDECNSGNASTSSNMAVRIRSANRCGQGSDVLVPLQISGGFFRMAGPNPATDRISVEIDEIKANMKLKSIALVSNLTTNTVKQVEGKTLSGSKLEKFIADIEVSKLDRGVYYLMLNFADGKSFKEGIILQ